MPLGQRSTAVLQYLLQNTSYSTVTQLAEHLNVSNRTLYNDLSAINDWLSEQGFQQLQQSTGRGVKVHNDDRETLKRELRDTYESDYVYAHEERVLIIFLFLSAHPYERFTVNRFCDGFNVSRNTTLDDIKALKALLSDYQLSLHFNQADGYLIKGAEKEKRRAMVSFINKFNQETAHVHWNDQSHFHHTFSPIREEEWDWLTQQLIDLETNIGIEFTDELLYSLITRFSFFIRRLQLGCTVKMEPVEHEVMKGTAEYEGIADFFEAVKAYFAFEHAQEDETVFFAAHLLSARVNHLDIPSWGEKESQQLKHVIYKMIEEFEQLALIEIKDYENLANNMLIHLKPAYFRMVYNIEVDNQLVTKIRENYPEIFNLTRQVVFHFERLVGKKISLDEVAYIAMHFGGWLRKEGIDPDQRRSLAIVCPSGIGTSRLMENQLQGLLTGVDIEGVYSLREYKRSKINADVIVSTIPLPERGVPVIVAPPILSDQEKVRIIKEVNQLFQSTIHEQHVFPEMLDVIKRHATVHDEAALKRDLKQMAIPEPKELSSGGSSSLSDILPLSRTDIIERVPDWQSAVEHASQGLIRDGIVTSHYVQSMIQLIEEKGPYVVISPEVAIPHAKSEDGVLGLGISLLLLRHSVNLKGKNVKLFIVLATPDEQSHLKPLTQLTEMMSDQAAKTEILQQDDRERLHHFIETYFSEE
ncbi:BglG family transcription antiterminator [Thalassobacillus sp. CUG 92003]|uniref:BglG family transcription antiterminator n=1 Tax=Thalassobacillus sp. CUG 92003 TaxID=2736641 RepID=UPI0015E6877A|nr:BglG family transcription antiterminator [Thalassobacillus sp. CUG 92003]